MVYNTNAFVWSDNWYIENNSAWFVDGERDLLYCLNLDTNEGEHAWKIPNEDPQKYRLNPRCIKCGSEIFCMPDIGNSIWIFHIENSQFQEMKIENPKRVRISIMDFWQYEEKLFAVSAGLKQIIEINISEKQIDNYYMLCGDLEAKLSKSVRVGDIIYTACSNLNRIYQFNLITRDIEVHTISGIEDGFWAICFDGEKIWLSGCRKAVYVWNPNDNAIKVIESFPPKFGIYDYIGTRKAMLDCDTIMYDTPAFIDSMVVGQYVWFVPFKTNKVIYLDKNTCQMHVFDIDGEEESRQSLSINSMGAKYLVQYVYDNRYIGLFSFKNNCIIEIDIEDLVAEKKKYSFNNECWQKIVHMSKNFFYEQFHFQRLIYNRMLLESELKTENEASVNVGTKIYQEVAHSR